MPTLDTVQPVKKAGFVGTGSPRDKRKAKIEAEEAELKAMMEGKTDEGEDKEKPRQEDGQEDQVQAAADTEEDPEPTSAEERTFKKRYGDLRRHAQQKEKDLQDRIAKLEERIKDGSGGTPTDPEEIAKWAKENPDVASIIETIAEQKANERFEGANERLKKLDEEHSALQRSRSEQLIRKAHPDFDKLRDDDTFHDWADNQPKWVRDALYENEDDPKSVVRVIDLYKMDNGLTVQDRKAKAKLAASDVGAKSTAPEVENEKPTYKESQIKKNSDKWFEQNWDAIQEAMKEGRFVYDLSGGAR